VNRASLKLKHAPLMALIEQLRKAVSDEAKGQPAPRK
jgi:hypothetical protein